MTEHGGLTQSVRQQAVADDVGLGGSDVFDRVVVIIKRQLLSTSKRKSPKCISARRPAGRTESPTAALRVLRVKLAKSAALVFFQHSSTF